MTGVRKAGARIEEILDGLPAGAAHDAAEELVRVLIELYGEGLEHVVEVLGTADPSLVGKLAEDPLVESLLLVHGLHPLDADARAQRALDQVRPYLGSHAGGVEYLGIDAESVLHLRLAGSCNGCASSTLTVKLAIEGALLDAVPEAAAIDVEGMAAEAESGAGLLQIGFGPPHGDDFSADESWAALPDLGPPTGGPTALEVEGLPLIVCSYRGTLYAYRDHCPACGSQALGEGTQEGGLLTCPGCGQRYDVRLAGRAVDDQTLHLDPLPLLSDSHGTRVALPKAAVR